MKQTKLDDGVKHLAIDEADLILTNWVEGVDAQICERIQRLA